MSEIPAETKLTAATQAGGIFDRREKLLLAFSAMIAFAAFWWSGRTFRIPTYEHFSASLLRQPDAISALLVTAVTYLACVLVGTVLAGIIRFDAGLFSASVGLCALTARGGPIRFTLFSAPTAGIFLSLFFELALIASLTGIGWLLQQALGGTKLLREEKRSDGITEQVDTIDQKLLALGVNITVMIIVMLFLGQSDRKIQVLAAVGIASFLGTTASHYVGALQPSPWHWSAPLVAGLIGYGLAYFGDPGGWSTGHLRGMFAPLARPLPLDYAGIGVAGSLLGYWMNRGWHRDRLADAQVA